MNLENRKRELLEEIESCSDVLHNLNHEEDNLFVEIETEWPMMTSIVSSHRIDKDIVEKFIEEVKASYQKKIEELKKELETL